MIDWRETGRQIFETLKKAQADRFERRASRVRPVSDLLNAEQQLFLALECSAQGHTDILVKYLLSAKSFSLSKRSRDELAEILRRKDWGPKRGRRPDRHARLVCEQARSIYLCWKQSNRQNGVSNWGLGDQMKDEACHYALILGKTYGWQPDFETVRQLMERPKKRQTL